MEELTSDIKHFEGCRKMQRKCTTWMWFNLNAN